MILLIALLISLPALSTQTSCVANATNSSNGDDTLTGVLLTIIPIVCFGSNYLPVKSFDTGDGVFFQWVMSVAILIGGFVTYSIQKFPPFYVGAMIGGCIWSLGNLCVVPIVRLVGLSIGLLIWAITCMIVGWAVSTFGLFGTDKSELCYDYLNYTGVAVCAIGAAMIAFVKPSLDKKEAGSDQENSPLLSNKSNHLVQNQDITNEEENSPPSLTKDSHLLLTQNVKEEKGFITKVKHIFKRNTEVEDPGNGDGLEWVESLHPILRKTLGVGLGVLSGTFYGFQFTPINVLTTESKHSNNSYLSPNTIDYAFPYTVGIFLMATLSLVIYCVIKLNKPYINPKVLLPGLLSGGIWATASMSWIYINGILSGSISFPIVSSGPPIVSSLWGILLFREIRGLKNLLLFLFSFAVILTGVMLVSLSKFNLG